MHNPVYVVMRYRDDEDDMELEPSIEKVFSHIEAAQNYIESQNFEQDDGPQIHTLNNTEYDYVSIDDQRDRYAVFKVDITMGENIEECENDVCEYEAKPVVTISKPSSSRITLSNIPPLSSFVTTKEKTPPKPVVTISKPSNIPAPVKPTIDIKLDGDVFIVSGTTYPKKDILKEQFSANWNRTIGGWLIREDIGISEENIRNKLQ